LQHELLEREENSNILGHGLGCGEDVGIARRERGELHGDPAASDAGGELFQREMELAIGVVHARLQALGRDPREDIVEREHKLARRGLGGDQGQIAGEHERIRGERRPPDRLFQVPSLRRLVRCGEILGEIHGVSGLLK